MTLNKTTKKLIGNVQKQGGKPLDKMSMKDYRDMMDSLKSFQTKIIDMNHSDYKFKDSENKTSLIVRNYFPKDADEKELLPTILYYPGGGFIANGNDPETHIDVFSHIVTESHCRLIRVPYRLAPEHQFPHGLNDAYAITRSILSNMKEYGINPDKLIIAGDSSGANFATLIALRLNDDKVSETDFVEQILISPVVDMSMSLQKHKKEENEDALLGEELVQWTCGKYVPKNQDPKDPKMSPYWRKDLSTLPKTTIIVAEHDRFRSQSEAYHEKLVKQGVNSSLHTCEGQVHSFLTMRGALNEGENPIDLINEHVQNAFKS